MEAQDAPFDDEWKAMKEKLVTTYQCMIRWIIFTPRHNEGILDLFGPSARTAQVLLEYQHSISIGLPNDLNARDQPWWNQLSLPVELPLMWQVE